MRLIISSFALLFAIGCSSPAQVDPTNLSDPYIAFVGQYSAAVKISNECGVFTTYRVPAAAEIAQTERGLNAQPVLRLLYYGKTTALSAAGDATLRSRGVDAGETSDVCKFGHAIVGRQDDTVGRLLRLRED